ncbi:uncharacterized protein FIBRA_07168 [Fibroporia radiculosa]|uniref:NAD(P)-binding protein n=1 Tax=Fibroporia radiculosa TaxID=599839 RepID=J4GUG4_9APHY|nr:uncharacterized protein FIBRA_07168 [Fibroporia radiculosa]CCM04970.1 predicted protein [Fibroporia radiculosa]
MLAAMLGVVSSLSKLRLISTLFALSLPVFLVSRHLLRIQRRVKQVPRTYERVLILGGSSGIGRALAHEYAARGARVCITARREEELRKVVEECNALPIVPNSKDEARIFSVVTDFTNVEDMVHLRTAVEDEWQGVDTLIICAGVSALRPLMEVAGLERDGRIFTPSQATLEGIQKTVDIADKAAKVNYMGPLISAVTFIPLLQRSSLAPSVLLISTMAALVPAPTRSLYASTKAASLLLFQALAIEHPLIRFSFAIPATVKGNFRASAVDGGIPREYDPNEIGITPKDVARRCARAIDAGEKYVFMPYLYSKFGHWAYWLAPTFVEWRAGLKYHFAA